MKERPIVSVLGPRGTNTERVAIQRWGQRAKIEHVRDTPEIFYSVSEKQADYGVIPVEDSVEGDVTLSLDLLRKYDLYVTEELQTFVTHCLLAKGKKEEIKTIASHPQVLRHCQRYIEMNFPDAAIMQTRSTAEAAELASTNPSIGAIADEGTAKIYNLNVVGREVHDYGSNTTRFFVLAREPVKLSGPVKTSIAVDIPEDRPGALYGILEEFAKRSINLTKIISRPTRRFLGEYTFFIDLEGNQEDSKVKETFKAIRGKAAIRSFGSYPYPTKMESEHILKKAKSQVTEEELCLMESSSGFWDNKEDRAYDSL